MTVTAVVGAQWGDEGKGKIVDYLATQADVVIRFQGGNNAGHTVVNDQGEFKLHIVPCGIFNPATKCIIGTGTVVNPVVLLSELRALQQRGVATDNLLVSSRAHVLMPYHVLLDRLEEEARGEQAIGTTLRGVGPCYVDKVRRSGLQMSDLLDPASFRSKVIALVAEKNQLMQALYGHQGLDPDAVFNEIQECVPELAKHIGETLPVIHEAIASDRKVVLEGQLGALRDLDWGTYPYVTSSNPIAGGASAGAGIPPHLINDVLGVVKAYSTSVGEGPMPTELLDQDGDNLRRLGNEYGATTGRPRRCGWFDAVAVRYAHMLNGFDRIAVTKLDVLDTLDEIKFCVAYEVEGERWHTVPDPRLMQKVQPVYETLPGWKESTAEARSLSDLPPNAQRYLRRLEELIDARIGMISVGPEREQTFLV